MGEAVIIPLTLPQGVQVYPKAQAAEGAGVVQPGDYSDTRLLPNFPSYDSGGIVR